MMSVTGSEELVDVSQPEGQHLPCSFLRGEKTCLMDLGINSIKFRHVERLTKF